MGVSVTAPNSSAAVSGLSIAAYAAIKQDIIRCELEPGSTISRARLVERYGFGETTVRDALSRLSQEHLVQAVPREGYVIAPITLKQIRDLFGVRLVLEPAIARMAAESGNADELRAIVARDETLYSFTDRTGLAEYVRANTTFHMALAEAAGNERMVSVLASLLDEVERVMFLSYVHGERPPGGYRAHGILVDAIAARDGERAASLMEQSLVETRRFVLESLLFLPSLQQVNLGATRKNSPDR